MVDLILGFVNRCFDLINASYRPNGTKKTLLAKGEASRENRRLDLLAELENQDVLDQLVYRECQRQKNLKNIIEPTLTQLPEHARPEDMDKDWLAYFFSSAEMISDKTVQNLWCGILLGEATKPGSFSKKTLTVLATLGRKEAELFLKLCQFVVMIDSEAKALIWETDEGVFSTFSRPKETPNYRYRPHYRYLIQNKSKLRSMYHDAGLNYRALMVLASLGLIIIRELEMGKPMEFDGSTLTYYGQTMLEHHHSVCWESSYVELSFVGQELYALAHASSDSSNKNDQFLEVLSTIMGLESSHEIN
jgi:uncharacterized repeat protein (TIGR03899 family)